MIFTVGKISVYEPYIRDDENPRKLGRDDTDYIGGSVWKSFEEAHSYLEKSELIGIYRVYGVLADWDKDTEPSQSAWNNLLVSSRLVKISAQQSVQRTAGSAPINKQ